MRKIRFIVALIVVLMFTLAACGGGTPAPAPAPVAPAATDPAAPGTDVEVDVDWPTRPITLYVAFSAGGSTDLMARFMADYMSRDLGVPVTIVNVEGAGGFVAWTEFVRNADPDGYSLVAINTPNLIMGRYDAANPREFDHTDMDPVANHVTDPMVVTMRPGETRFTDMESLIEFARENDVLFGASAAGMMNAADTLANRMNREFGTRFTMVGTTGDPESITLLLNGSTDITMSGLGATLTTIRNGEAMPIGISNSVRSRLLPDVPIFSEAGLGDIIGHSSRGYALPLGVDPAIRELVAEALNRAINAPEVMEQNDNIGAETNYIGGDEFHVFLDAVRYDTFAAWGVELPPS